MAVSALCQTWGGPAGILVPTDQTDDYRASIAGGQIDRMLLEDRGASSSQVDALRFFEWNAQPAITLLKPNQQDDYAALTVPQLAPGDPWRDIYFACLGDLPPSPDRFFTEGSQQWTFSFDDFLHIARPRVQGSLADLLARVGTALSCRKVAMVDLAYGRGRNPSLASEPPVLPVSHGAAREHGPNVVVVCAPHEVRDVALLWNLRASTGDTFSLPIGIPSTESLSDAVTALLVTAELSTDGWPDRAFCVTSASLSSESLREALGPELLQQVEIVSPFDAFALGTVRGRSRAEVAHFEASEARIVPPAADAEFEHPLGISPMSELRYDIVVEEAPAPESAGVRLGGASTAFYGGSLCTWGSFRQRHDPTSFRWPTRRQFARAFAQHAGLEIAESAAGRAAHTVLSGFDDIQQTHILRHAPLLELLGQMADSQGASLMRAQARALRSRLRPRDTVARSSQELPDRTFDAFKQALGNNSAAATNWLQAAEKHHVVVRGFQVQCLRCDAQQWLPIDAFAPPISCGACGSRIAVPFPHADGVKFRYRLSERMRRLFEHDAIAHVLVASHLDALFYRGFQKSDLLGVSLGMDVRGGPSRTTIGEADVLLFTSAGAFVPIEAKRTAAGVNDAELGKLAALVEAFSSPWSAVAVAEYAKDTEGDLNRLHSRRADGTLDRALLTFDHLLDPSPFWGAGSDPFEPRQLSSAEVRERERGFCQRIGAATLGHDWFEHQLLRPSRQTGLGKNESR